MKAPKGKREHPVILPYQREMIETAHRNCIADYQADNLKSELVENKRYSTKFDDCEQSKIAVPQSVIQKLREEAKQQNKIQ